jgi:predicted nucleic acid-binding protein
MKVLVDTPIWSLALRRTRVPDDATTSELATLIADGRVALIGPVRQELLSGIKEQAQFEKLKDHLRAFPDLEITAEDYEDAAALFNLCRKKGLHGSNTDFLICAIATRRDCSIFTNDRDFSHFSSVLPIRLHEVSS